MIKREYDNNKWYSKKTFDKYSNKNTKFYSEVRDGKLFIKDIDSLNIWSKVFFSGITENLK